MSVTSLSRRALLQTGGALILGSFVAFRRAGAAPGLPPANTDPNVFLKIGPDDTVTILSKHLEMGQGVVTGLATLVAEELDADWAQMRFDFAPAIPALYRNLDFGPFMGTGGSTAMHNSYDQMRLIGAHARVLLIEAAAGLWKIPVPEVTVAKGILTHAGSGQTLRFGAVAGLAMKRPVPKTVALKDPAHWTLVGKRLPRLDSVPKTEGKAVFALDFRRPGTLTAVVKRPPLFGATVAGFDDAAARRVPGVVDVIQISGGVAVLATDTWAAMQGREALQVRWNEAKAETRSTAAIIEEYRTLAAKPGAAALKRGDAAGGLKKATKIVEAEFVFPYLAHTPMEPLNCTLELTPEGAHLSAGSQLQSVDLIVIAKILGLKPEQVTIDTMLAGGSFGRRGMPNGTWVAEAAEMVKAIGGRAPVHMVMTREDDVKGGFYRPQALHKVRAGIDAQGRILGWEHRVVGQSIFAGTPFEANELKGGVDSALVEGVRDTLYGLDQFTVEARIAQSPVPVLWFRSVGNSHTAHVMETMMDALAQAAGHDPVEYRLGLLAKDKRAAAVVKLAAEKAGWGEKLPPGRGRGFAFHHCFNTRVAMVADVTVTAGKLRVDRVVAAVDCGVPINPDVITAQVEGAVGFALGTVLRNRITMTDGAVEQGNFDDYEPARIHEMPRVEVHIVPSTEHPTGIGEPGVAPLAPAIGNAVFAATGKRSWGLPVVV